MPTYNRKSSPHQPIHRPVCRSPFLPPPPCPQPPRRHRGRAGAIVGAVFLGAGIAMIAVFSRLQSSDFSSQDRHYLAVIRNPCEHSEVLDTTRCSSWGQQRWHWPDDKTLVKDANDVCAAEAGAPWEEKIRTGGSLIAARHPAFFDLQVGVEEVAARNVYCPNVIAPAGESPDLAAATGLKGTP